MTKTGYVKRYAIVKGARSRREAEAYLPDNYRIIYEGYDSASYVGLTFVIEGRDSYGWTLDSYVIPRYASGGIVAQEIDLSHPIMRLVPA